MSPAPVSATATATASLAPAAMPTPEHVPKPASFDAPVAPGGYAWWYIDALSDDGRHGLTLIAFIGSVFSPYYAWARRKGQGVADPLNHCTLNVALYASPGTSAPTAWAMTERGRAQVRSSAAALHIGRSAMQWEGDALAIHIDEVTTPWARPLRGVVRLHPLALLSQTYALDGAGLHHWQPIAPCSRVEVELSHPGLRWRGTGYLDSNRGQRPLDQDFKNWDWSRAALKGQRTAVLYDATRTDGSTTSLALAFAAQGAVQHMPPPPCTPLPATQWRLQRTTRSDAANDTSVIQGLEDGPFYSRSLLRTQLLGESATAVHESLSLQRWKQLLVQAMLPFRMPRRG